LGGFAQQLKIVVIGLQCYKHQEFKVSSIWFAQIIKCVPELKIWKTNLKSVATYFRISALRTKRLAKEQTDYKAFPAYFEVRFAEHLHSFIESVLHNMFGCRAVWESIKCNPAATKLEKLEAEGFFKVWADNSLQLWLTSVMGDVVSVYQTMQMQLQRGDLIMPDILTCRDSALRKLAEMEDGPYPGGFENMLCKQSYVSTSSDEYACDQEPDVPSETVVYTDKPMTRAASVRHSLHGNS
jgi:hypothetical protein